MSSKPTVTSWTTNDCRAAIERIVTDYLGLSESAFSWHKPFMSQHPITGELLPDEGLGADSLDMVELILAFEDEFDLDISDQVAARLNTPEDVFTYARALGLVSD